jgi:hypothetical protein
MKPSQKTLSCRLAHSIVVAAVLSGCASPVPTTTEETPNIFEMKVATGFRLDVTVEEETLTEKKVRAAAETEITSVRRALSRNSAERCIARARPGDVFLRESKAAPGRMALTGAGARLDQGGQVGRVSAESRVYFLGPMENVDAAAKHQLSDFIVTSPEHPALAGAQLATFRLDIIATPGGDVAPLSNCTPDLGASRRYEDGGVRRTLVWHGVDLTGVPEAYFAGMLQDTRDVSIAILDSGTRVPITNATIKMEDVDSSLMSYARFVERYLSGVDDAFILNLYAEFADSDFFEFTAAKSDHRDGGKIRLLKEQSLTVSISATAPGYLPVMGQANLGAGQTNLRVFMIPEGAAQAELRPPGVETN